MSTNPWWMQAPSYYGNDNPWLSFLDIEPQQGYFSSPSGRAFASRSPRAGRYFQNQFQDIYNQYLGGVGQAIRSGRNLEDWPSWSDYLETDPFTKRYAALTPEQAGRTTGQFSPSTRQIYY